MAITFDTHTLAKLTDGTSHSQSHTTGSDNAKVAAVIMGENATAYSGVQFGGIAMTVIGTPVTQNSMQIAAYYLDSSLAAGARNLTFTSGPDDPIVYIESFYGAASGAPEDFLYDNATDQAAVGDTADLSVSAGAFIMGAAANSQNSRSITSWDTLTIGDSDASAGIYGVQGQAENASGGTTSVDATWNFALGDQVFFAGAFPPAGAAASEIPPARSMPRASPRINTGSVMHRAVEKVNGLWVPSRKIIRPRLVPVGIAL